MKSQLLAGKLREIFGGEGEAVLGELLAGAAAQHPALVTGISRFLETADGLIAQYAGLHQVQSELAADAFSNWNLQSGRIESGRQWKTLLGYADDALVPYFPERVPFAHQSRRLEVASAQRHGHRARCRR